MKAYSTQNIRNVVLLGSTKSGKTTLSEAMLYEGKVIDRRGTVEGKNTVSDNSEIEQINHKITRLENRQKYFEDGERKRRTHRLCTIAGTLESIAPEIKELDITEVMELLEYVFHKEDVQQAVSRMKKAHDLRNRKAKEG